MQPEPDLSPQPTGTVPAATAPQPGPPGPGAAPVAGAREPLERKLSFYRRMTVFLGATSVFLGVVVVAQLAMDSPAPPAAVGTTPAAETPVPGVTADPVPQPTTPVAYADSPVVRRAADDPMALGAIDAPVVLSKWTDFRCPYCAAFGRTTLPQIIDEYVDAGLVRIEVHDVAFFGEQSQGAAVAARAAGEQGLYFEYLHAVSAAAPESGHADLPREALLAFAEEVGVPDLDRFTADLDDPGLWTAVQDSTATAQYLGVSGVPFFVVGEAALSGAYPMDVFRQVLDEALAQAG